MKQHELNGKTILLVGVPEGAQQLGVWMCRCGHGKTLIYMVHEKIISNANMSIEEIRNIPLQEVSLPEGNWKFFATTDTITEEQATELVESLEGDLGDYANSQHRGYIVKFYKDYNHTGKLSNWLPTANGISGNNACLIRIFYES